MRRRAQSILLTLCLLVGMLPTAALAEGVAVANSADQSGNALLEAMETQSTTKPDGFDDDTANPYGVEEGETVTLLEKTELFSFVSSNLSSNKMNKTLTGEGTASTGALGLTERGTSWIPDGKVLLYTQGVGFDPLGESRRTHVGLVGYDATSKTMKVYVLDADADAGQDGSRLVKEFEIASGDAAAWVEKVDLDTVDSANYFQITAGDYDGDGRESLVVYCGAMTGAGDGLTEISWNGSSWITTKVNVSGLFNSAYLTEGGGIYNAHKAAGLSDSERKNPGNRLAVSMDTGDVNGDGIDDLVVVSSTGQLSSTYTKSTALKARRLASIPRLAVAYGSKKAASDGTVAAQTINDLAKTSTDVKDASNHMPTAAGVSIGDIDGDGANEVAVAGFMNYWKDEEKTINLQDSKVVFAYYNCDSGSLQMGGGLQELSGSDVSPINKLGESVRSNESSWQQFSVECVAFDGLRSQEYVFLNGYFYKLSGTTLSCVGAAKLDPFTSYKNKGNFGGIKDANENFVHSAAVGNLYGTDDGREAICLTVGYKENGEDDYSFLRVTVRKNADGSFAVVGNTDWSVVNHNGDNWNEKLNCIVVAVDYDHDSVIGKYVGKAFTYSDPNVVAFLQAAPYFAELDPGNSSTTYSYSESYTRGTGKSTELSYNVGATGSVSVGVVTTSGAVGKAYEVTDEYAESRTTEYTTTFEASERNQVIVRRTLIYDYYYEVMGTDGQFGTTNVLYVSVPQHPVMTSMSQDQYNEFAAAFNAKYGTAKRGKKGEKTHRLDIIEAADVTKYHLDNEGNPFGYANNPGEYAGGVDLSNNQWMQLSYAVGTTQQECTTSLEESQTHTAADGLYANMSIEVGGGTKILGVGVSVSAGVEAGYERLSGTISSTSRMTSTSTGGAVQNLSADLAEYGYGFTWKLIGWKGGSDLFDGVLFVGYAVRGVTAPVNAVEDLSATYVGATAGTPESVTLSWTAPEPTEGRSAIAGFKVYRVDGDEYVALTDAACDVAWSAAGAEHAYTVDVSAYEVGSATFVVRSVASGGAKDSLYSNEAYVLFALSGREAQALVEATRADLQGKIDALEAAQQAGNAQAIAQAVADLTAAYQAADAQLKVELQGADDAIRAELKAQMDEAAASLRSAINQVQSNLDTATQELRSAIEAGDDANGEALRQAVADLTAAYQAADELLRLQVRTSASDLAASLDELGTSMAQANQALQAAIDELSARLDATGQRLQGAIDAGDAANAQALEDAAAQLRQEHEEATAQLTARVASLEDTLVSLREASAQREQELQSAIDAQARRLAEAQGQAAQTTSQTNARLDALEASAGARGTSGASASSGGSSGGATGSGAVGTAAGAGDSEGAGDDGAGPGGATTGSADGAQDVSAPLGAASADEALWEQVGQQAQASATQQEELTTLRTVVVVVGVLAAASVAANVVGMLRRRKQD